MKIVIAGGTGFIGKYLKAEFEKMGYDIIVISRRGGDIQWNDLSGIIGELENSTMLINLAGKSVDCRYNEKNKAQILFSRTETTRILGEAIEKCIIPPEVWINSSTATIYRHAEDRPMTENDGEIGIGFSVEVATAWEKEFFSFELKNTRQVALRLAIVLGKDGGVIKPFTNLVKFGLGGRQGLGNQMFSWIHIDDVTNIIKYIMEHTELTGVLNVSSPNPVTNNKLMDTFRRKANVKFGLPSPAWLLKIGAIIINTEAELILKSRWVIPERLLNSGYKFKYPTLNSAIDNILTKS